MKKEKKNKQMEIQKHTFHSVTNALYIHKIHILGEIKSLKQKTEKKKNRNKNTNKY